MKKKFCDTTSKNHILQKNNCLLIGQEKHKMIIACPKIAGNHYKKWLKHLGPDKERAILGPDDNFTACM